MELLFEDKKTGGFLIMNKESPGLKGEGILKSTTINSIVYNKNGPQKVIIDEVPYTFNSNTVLTLMANQHFVFERPDLLTAWQFNREFYCIVDHDVEVGCVGFIFYGTRQPLFTALSDLDKTEIGIIEKLCIADMKTKDRMQGEMLRTMLKRLIISITRIARKACNNPELSDEKLDLVRMFNLLLEGHYKNEHEVQFYAQALNKSPKTLSNLFALLGVGAPSKLIKDRIILEAKRYLQYTDKSAKEIAYSLGFTSPAHFSRFFKQHTGENILAFKGTEVKHKFR
ncbi:helix-turn-helix domain-containing protein [Pedobacter africanus]|uniref:Transcriptional regulator, AraC family n=1 Tax=Pedobacter africanus TaxID=151894 RepID=A0A1W1Z0V3_9SPHI|nr:helix-turn-helix domain-containing protein [Pedobacter africanus]SMC42097.1 transcriptional regulator, AraC family [Pedobacter africanus]